MRVSELIKRLKKFEQSKELRFYFLKHDELNGCELETIISPSDSGRVELTIQDENELETHSERISKWKSKI